MLTDSHCHLGSYKFEESEILSLINNAREAGVSRMITLATELSDLEKNLHLAQKHEEVFCCLGIHPCDVAHTPEHFIDILEPLAKEPQCVAIGETGLDYYHPAPDDFSNEQYYEKQRSYLDLHFQLAQRIGKNVVVHTRDKKGSQSLEDALFIYKKYASSVSAVFHCYISELKYAEEIIALGGIVSFTGIATFKNPGHVLDVARVLPKGSFMVETDSPYLAPVPHRGKRCEPAYVRYTAERIALARGESFEEFLKHIRATEEKFFRFP